MNSATDVFIIGGGPAGLAAAIAARRKGFDVTLADLAAPGADKACGEGVLPEGVAALRRLGIEIPESESCAFRGIRFLAGGVVAEASFDGGFGAGIRRTALHALLAARAAERGVRLLWNTPVTGIAPDCAFLRDGRVLAHWIIATDGGRSRVRGWMGLDPRTAPAGRYGVRRHFRASGWTDFVEVYWGREAQFYVSRAAADEVCVVLISRQPGLRIETALPDFPELAARLRGAEAASTSRGALTCPLRLPRVYRECWALLGDASGSVDAISGQGLTLAFLQAEALAEAIGAGDLSLYRAAHRRIMRRPALISRLLLALADRPQMRSRVLRILSDEPRLFARLLAAHAGTASAAESTLGGLHLGWRLLAS